VQSGFPTLDLTRDALLFDVDGTLIDIAPTPEAVVVPTKLRLALHLLWDRSSGATALVSGRPLASLDSLFAPLRLPASGTHGAQVRAQPESDRLAFEAPLLPASLRAGFDHLGDQFEAVRIEDKHYSLAFHYRGHETLEAALIQELEKRMQNLPPGFELLKGKAILEIRAQGVNKGDAVRRLLRYPPFKGRRPVFFGDDHTDEDCLAVLPEFAGIGVAVGRDLKGADYLVTTPEEVRHWLAQLTGL
jgi:trehalose 6-phosphate phosphatase